MFYPVFCCLYFNDTSSNFATNHPLRETIIRFPKPMRLSGKSFFMKNMY